MGARLSANDTTAAESPAERYAAGQMGESEELAFEIRMLEDPRLAAEVDAIHRMRDGFRVLDLRGDLARSRGTWVVRVRYALAAMLALVVVGGTVFVMSVRSTGRAVPPALAGSLAGLGIKASGTRAITATLLLAHTRGQEAPTAVTQAGNPDVIALKILPAVAGTSGEYRASLERLDAKGPQATTASVGASSDQSGFVTLYLDASRLTPGMYRLSLTQAVQTEEFMLQVAAGK